MIKKDISVYQDAFEALEASKEVYYIKTDLAGNYSYVNTYFAQKFAFISSNFIGLPFGITVYEKDIEKCNQTAIKCIENPGKAFSVQVRKLHPSDGWFWNQWEFMCSTDADGNPKEIICIGFDITNERMALLKQGVYYEKFRSIADNAPVLIWVSDEKGSINFFNKSWLQFTGRNQLDELGDGWLAGVHPDDQEMCITTYKNCFNLHKPFEMTYRLKHHSGQYRWILDKGAPNYMAGIFNGYIGSCVDIHQIVEAKRKMEELIEDHSHMVRKPLANIMALVNLLYQHQETNDQLTNQWLEMLHESADDLDKKIRLVVSKI